ncbi:MAG: zinc ribbon domain-containing protein [Candidatus Omnitrophica bacterium]|nr:zinc ribbon domain-containing protein [Candidatus Omnitrophota bacterium]
MLKKFLKRFERLENNPQDLVNQDCRISKRFEFLEVGDKKIQVEIKDTVCQEEHQQTAKANQDLNYKLLCPYCGNENLPEAQNCSFCRQPLKTKMAEEYQKTAKTLKKCPSCQAINQSGRKNCWVCGLDFTMSGDRDTQRESNNVITLNIDGKIYSSTDDNLPIDIQALMGRIRKEGYSSAVIDDWIRNRNLETELKKETTAVRLEELRSAMSWRIFLLGAALLVMLLQFRACFFGMH